MTQQYTYMTLFSYFGDEDPNGWFDGFPGFQYLDYTTQKIYMNVSPYVWEVMYPIDYSIVENTPNLFSGDFIDLTGRPTHYPCKWEDLEQKPNFFSGSYPDLSNKPVIGKAVTGSTVKSNSFRTYKNATVASGTATFHLTDDGLSTGNALYTEIFTDSIQISVNDATATYQLSWAFSNSNKTLTVTANKLGTANILTGLLGQIQANGANLRLIVEGR